MQYIKPYRDTMRHMDEGQQTTCSDSYNKDGMDALPVWWFVIMSAECAKGQWNMGGWCDDIFISWSQVLTRYYVT